MPRCRRSSKRRSGGTPRRVDGGPTVHGRPTRRLTPEIAVRAGLAPPDHDRRRELVVAHDPRLEAAGGDERGGGRRLAPAGLDEQVPARSEPLASGCRDATVHVEPVGSAVERLAPRGRGLGRHHRDLGRGHVRRVHGEHVHPAQQVARQRVEEVARHHARTERFEVAAGGQHCRGGSTSAAVSSRRRRRRRRPRRSPRRRSTGRRPRVAHPRRRSRPRGGSPRRRAPRCDGAARTRRARGGSAVRRTPPSRGAARAVPRRRDERRGARARPRHPHGPRRPARAAAPRPRRRRSRPRRH